MIQRAFPVNALSPHAYPCITTTPHHFFAVSLSPSRPRRQAKRANLGEDATEWEVTVNNYGRKNPELVEKRPPKVSRPTRRVYV